MADKIKFLDKEYTKDSLKGMSLDDLLKLRNLVASNMGVAAIKNFKDHDAAVEQTWKALVKYDTEADSDEKPKAKKEPKERKLAKPAEAQHVKRPTRNHFDVMRIVKPFDGEEDRSHRSANYKDGMMIIDAIEGEGTLPWDIYNWEKQGYVKVEHATDEEYAERRAAWYKKHGREDPEAKKEREKAEKAAAKKKREEEAAAKRKAKEEAAAKKKAEAEAKKDG